MSRLVRALAATVAFAFVLAGLAAAQTNPYHASMEALRKSPEKYQAWRRHLQDPGHHETVQGCIASATATTITVVPEEDFNPWMTRGTPVTFQVGPDTAMDPDVFFHGHELPAKDVHVNVGFRGQGDTNIAIHIHFEESGTCPVFSQNAQLGARVPEAPAPAPVPEPQAHRGTRAPTYAAQAQSAAQRIIEYPIGLVSGGITSGPDGALWFTGGQIIGRITTAGVITKFPIRGNSAAITVGPDRALWVSGYVGGKIARITTGGVINLSQTLSDPELGAAGITAGPDGAMWFTEPEQAVVGRMTTDGVVTKYYKVGEGGIDQPSGIAVGPDGALWFNDTAARAIGRITTVGLISRYPLPTNPADSRQLGGLSNADAGAAGPDITVGPDGALWFTEWWVGKIGRISTRGAIAEFAVAPPPATQANPVPMSGPLGIASGRDGALWFTENGADKIGRITTAGVITEFPLPRVPLRSVKPAGITSGPDGALWFTETGTGKIGRIVP